MWLSWFCRVPWVITRRCAIRRFDSQIVWRIDYRFVHGSV
jgi:hypothetical protein